MSDTLREAFEAWVRREYVMAEKMLRPGSGRWLYADNTTLHMWQTWQAALASPAALPDGGAPVLTAEMAVYLVQYQFKGAPKGTLEALRAIASGAHVVVPAVADSTSEGLEEVLAAIEPAIGDLAEAAALSLDHYGKDHSEWYRAVKRARKTIAALRSRK